jgi:hypothetical protein
MQFASTKTHTCLAWHTTYDLEASTKANRDVLYALLHFLSGPIYHR